MEAVFLEGKSKTKIYIDLQKLLVELGFMSQEKYDNVYAELTGGVFGYINADLLWSVSLSRYAMSSKRLDLKQPKADPCVLFRKSEKSEHKVIVLCYVDNCCIIKIIEHVENMKNKFRIEIGIGKDGQIRKLLGAQHE